MQCIYFGRLLRKFKFASICPRTEGECHAVTRSCHPKVDWKCGDAMRLGRHLTMTRAGLAEPRIAGDGPELRC